MHVLTSSPLLVAVLSSLLATPAALNSGAGDATRGVAIRLYA